MMDIIGLSAASVKGKNVDSLAASGLRSGDCACLLRVSFLRLFMVAVLESKSEARNPTTPVPFPDACCPALSRFGFGI